MRSPRTLSLLFAIAATCAAPLTPIAAQSVKLVTVTCGSTTLALGDRTTCSARVRLANGQYASNRVITWGSSKPTVALVTANKAIATVSTISAGTVGIAAIVGSTKGEATITVTPSTTPPPIPPPSHAVVTLTTVLASPTITIGTTTRATATAKDSAGDVVPGAPITWTSSASNVASVDVTGLVSGLSAGTASIRATSDPKTSASTVTVVGPAPPAPPIDTASTSELPRVFLTTTVASTPSTGRVLAVHAGGNLQAALDSARFGDRIRLDTGTTFRGNFVLPIPKTGNAGEWVTIESSGRKPPEGTRISPDSATAMKYPRIVGTNGVNTLITVQRTNHWRFIGIEVTVDSSVLYNQGAILVGDASVAQDSIAKVPTDFIFDRVYIHGQPNVDMRKCIAADGIRVSVIESYLSDCKSAFDAQAIGTTNGPGPFKIVNNFLEASGENIAMGGADTGIPGLVSADFEIRLNHIYKPLSWQGDSRWVEKNFIESKNSTRVLVDGNVLENSWVDGQVGYTLALWSVNQDGRCLWCITSHWTFRNNLIKNASAGVNLTSVYALPGRVNSVPMHHVSITNNVWLGLTASNRFMQMDTIPFTTIEHNTAMYPGGAAFVFGFKGPAASIVIRNNMLSGYYGVTAYWGGGAAAWADVGAGAGSVWMKNVVQTQFGWIDPPMAYGPTTVEEIGFVGGTDLTSSIDNLVLTALSPYHNLATDGTDIGANIAAVKAATAGVTSLTASRTP